MYGISQCPHCYCVTNTFNGLCGKCRNRKMDVKTMIVNVKKLNDKATLPARAHDTDAGFDLTATSVVEKDGMVVCGTGLAFEIPVGYVGLIFPRSSIAKTSLQMSNCVGVADSGYRGEIICKFRKCCGGPINLIYEVGERIAQIIIMPFPEVSFKESEALSDSPRGANGFGSTGK